MKNKTQSELEKILDEVLFVVPLDQDKWKADILQAILKWHTSRLKKIEKELLCTDKECQMCDDIKEVFSKERGLK